MLKDFRGCRWWEGADGCYRVPKMPSSRDGDKTWKGGSAEQEQGNGVDGVGGVGR